MKRTKTLSFQLSIIFLGGMAFTMAAGAVATYLVQERIVKDFTTSRLRNSVYEHSKDVDDDFIRAQNTIANRTHLVEYSFKDKTDLADAGKVASVINEISTLFDASSHEYHNICAYYVVLNPEYAGGTAEDAEGKGFFHVMNDEGDFMPHEVTNILKYSADDYGHVGWWHIVANKKDNAWSVPYHNKNINKNMLSFVCPFYAENREDFLGVVGIDVDLDAIIADIDKTIDNCTEYNDVYPILINKDETIIHHKDVKTFDDNGNYVGTKNTLKDFAGIEDFKSSKNGAITYKYGNRRRTAMSMTLSSEIP